MGTQSTAGKSPTDNDTTRMTDSRTRLWPCAAATFTQRTGPLGERMRPVQQKVARQDPEAVLLTPSQTRATRQTRPSARATAAWEARRPNISC